MIISNLEVIPSYTIVAHYGMAQGNTVRSKNFGKDLFASFKNIVGGELKAYTELMEEARAEAVKRMSAEAESMGANAILSVRFTTTSISAGAAEVLAYGSAVLVELTAA